MAANNIRDLTTMLDSLFSILGILRHLKGSSEREELHPVLGGPSTPSLGHATSQPAKTSQELAADCPHPLDWRWRKTIMVAVPVVTVNRTASLSSWNPPLFGGQ